MPALPAPRWCAADSCCRQVSAWRFSAPELFKTDDESFVRPNIVGPHHGTPDVRLLGGEFAQLLRLGEHQRHLLRLAELPRHALLAQALDQRGAKAADDRLRRSRRRKDGPPGV